MLIATILHILDRQGDFVARTDFIWKAKLKVEQEEVETMRGINKVSQMQAGGSLLPNTKGVCLFSECHVDN